MLTRLSIATLIALLLCTSTADARRWTDSTGKHVVEADLIDFDKDTAVLKRTDDGKLISVPRQYLSEADRKYLDGEEAKKIHDEYPTPDKTWTLKDGRTFEGEVIGFARREVTFLRSGGKVTINDKTFDQFNDPQQLVILEVASHESGRPIRSLRDLGNWLSRLPGATYKILVEGVVMKLPDGLDVGAPFYFFDIEDQKVLKPGWDEWLASQKAEQEKSEADTFESDRAALYLRARARLGDEERRRNMELQNMANSIIIQDGFGISRWRVNLITPAGMRQVVVPGRDSLDAMANARARYPGANVAGAAKIDSGNYRW